MYKKEIVISGKKLTIETGQMAKQANGSVVLRYGDTVLLVTATANLRKQTNLNYFPLSVDYREKMYSAVFLPVQITNIPSAKGSKVPAWPIFLIFIIDLIFLTTSKDVQLTGFHIGKTKSIIYFTSF